MEDRNQRLNTMAPVLVVDDDFKTIYMNEAFDECVKLNEEGAEALKQQLETAKQDHPEYDVMVRKLTLNVEIMKRYATLRHDTYMMELIDRKADVISGNSPGHDVSAEYAFQQLFISKYPETKDTYRVVKRMDEYDAKHKDAKQE